MHARIGSIVWIRDPGRGLLFWGVLAAISLAGGAWIALQPDRSNDLGLMRVWINYWTATWTSPFHAEWLMVDYPPHAFVLLWPLDYLPANAAAWYLPWNLAVSAVFAWVVTAWAAHETGTPTRLRHHLVFACMLLTWGAVRAGLWHGQTVMCAAIAGVYAVRLAAHAPWLSGLALSLAATKPTLGAGFGLILLLRGGHRPFLIGVGASLALTMVFDVTVGGALLSSVGDFATGLGSVYTGHSYVRSATTIRGMMVDLSGGHPFAHVVFALYGIAALVALAHTVWPRRHHPDAQLLIASACLLWILLAMPNQRYYLILLAPLVWMLVWTPQAFARAGARWPVWIATGLVIFNVTDAPVALRYTAEYFGETSPFSLEWLWISSYGMVGPIILACFVMVLRALRRITSLR